MSEERRRFASELTRREAEASREQEEMQANSRKRAKFQEELEKEGREREKLREEIASQMQPSQYYQRINSVRVHWEQSLHFSPKLLRLAFEQFGVLKSVQLEKHNEAVVEFASIEAAERAVRDFAHPKIRLGFLVGEAKRREMLSALGQRKSEKADFSLSSDNLKRLAEMINRSSNSYVSLDSSRSSHYDKILKEAGVI